MCEEKVIPENLDIEENYNNYEIERIINELKLEDAVNTARRKEIQKDK